MMKTLKQRLSENQRLKYELFSLFEQDDPNAQQQVPGMASAQQTAAGTPPVQDPNAIPQDPNQQQQNTPPQVDETGEPIEQIISAINIIRSGRSFKDSPVKVELEKYLNDLDDKEKGILITFLKGLSQVASGQIPGDQAAEPEDNGKYKVISTSGGSKIQVKPAGGGGSATPQSQEDTTSPTITPPISAKQR